MSARSRTDSTPASERRSTVMPLRLRLSTSYALVRGSPTIALGRSMRSTSAPMSASIIAANGAGPIPASSITFTPCRGPPMSIPPARAGPPRLGGRDPSGRGAGRVGRSSRSVGRVGRSGGRARAHCTTAIGWACGVLRRAWCTTVPGCALCAVPTRRTERRPSTPRHPTHRARCPHTGRAAPEHTTAPDRSRTVPRNADGVPHRSATPRQEFMEPSSALGDRSFSRRR